MKTINNNLELIVMVTVKAISHTLLKRFSVPISTTLYSYQHLYQKFQQIVYSELYVKRVEPIYILSIKLMCNTTRGQKALRVSRVSKNLH